MSSCKVRFAPSPTGYLHIGNARVAVLNFLFCRKNSGKFLFRIDDTDAKRSTREYEDAIKRDIDWLGIEYDETFRQSERLDRYNQVLEDLRTRGLVYRCFESPEELEFKRKRALLKGLAPVYDREALQLTDEEMRRLEAEGKPSYWRFKLPDETMSWKDLVLKDLSYDLKNISDPVITKSDGTFLYSFCSIIDDLDSSVTHILRGQDHVTNTAVQLAMLKAIAPDRAGSITFAHFSLLVNKDGSQFSKRLGSMGIASLRSQGIEPMAICDLMATLGTSKDTLPFYKMDDLIEYFDISAFSSNSPRFDEAQLMQVSKKVVRSAPYEVVKAQVGMKMSPEAFEVIKENIANRQDLIKWDVILSDGFQSDGQNTDKEVLDALRLELSALGSAIKDDERLSVLQAEELLSQVERKTGKKGRDLCLPILMALTGEKSGPRLVDILHLLTIRQLKSRLGSRVAVETGAKAPRIGIAVPTFLKRP